MPRDTHKRCLPMPPSANCAKRPATKPAKWNRSPTAPPLRELPMRSSSYSRIAIDKIDILAVANGILYRPAWCGGRGKATGDEPPAFYAILIDPRSGICRAMRAVKGFAMAAAPVSKGSRKGKRAFAKSLASKKNSAKGLAWPVRLGRTEVRRKWHRRLSELPSGLSLREMVKRL